MFKLMNCIVLRYTENTGKAVHTAIYLPSQHNGNNPEHTNESTIIAGTSCSFAFTGGRTFCEGVWALKSF